MNESRPSSSSSGSCEETREQPVAVGSNVRSSTNNVGWLLKQTAQDRRDQLGVAFPMGRSPEGKREYRMVTFGELDESSDRIAAGLNAMGMTPGTRVALLVPQSIEFITLVFALFKAGLVQILIDPGMGRKNMIRCLSAARPEGLVAIPAAHVVTRLLGHRFPAVQWRVTVGRRWFWGGQTLSELQERELDGDAVVDVLPEDPAAIIFTTGSTGPPKGVEYVHRNFQEQARELQAEYGIQPGEIDLPGFPLFALFNAAMGVTTVIPDMDPTRPADIDPEKFFETANDFCVTQAFGSPALWNTVGRYADRTGATIPSLRRALSAGAPVPAHVLRRVRKLMHREGEMFTPYGATESLPVASQSASVVLGETQEASDRGAGTCVGGRFPGMEWRVIAIDDGELPEIGQTRPVAQGEIGELMVRGAVVTRRYVTSDMANRLHKVVDGETFWHRMGDVGYLDEQDRFWFCGRKSHRVRTSQGTLFTIPCEAILNTHPAIYRCGLVGVGQPGDEVPVIVAEPWPEFWPPNPKAQARLVRELEELAQQHELTRQIKTVLLKRKLPVDIRHNSKIFRERLRPWVARRLKSVVVGG